MGRIACAWIPHFELAVHLVKNPGLAAKPVFLADASKAQAKVLDANERAIARGALPGLALTSARALCPEATLVPPDAALVAAEGERILSALYRFAPTIGRDGRGAFFLALAGLERLHPDEVGLATRIQRVIREAGYLASVAIADGLRAAWIAARSSQALTPPLSQREREQGTIAIIPPGEDARAIARLPASALPMPEPLSELCTLLGVETVGDLQKLPKGSLSRRFGVEGARLERAAHADSAATFRAEAPTSINEATLDLELPLSDLEPLLFLIKSVLDRLLSLVAQDRRALALLEIVFVLDDRSTVKHHLRPASPTLFARPIIDLVRLWLSEKPLPSEVRAITLRAAEIAEAEAKQLRLFARRADEAGEAMEQAVARLIAVFGEEAVVSPQLADTWRPEVRIQWKSPLSGAKRRGGEPGAKRAKEIASAFGLAMTVIARRPTGPTKQSPPTIPPLHPVLRLLPEPVPIEIDQRWLRLPHSRAKPLTGLAGPYRLQGEWWQDPFERSYFVASTQDGGVYWLFRESGAAHLVAMVD
jgi:protein ImuB